MPALNRDSQIGRLTRLKQERLQLRVEIHNIVIGILMHFEPMDQDLIFVHNIIPERLRINVAEIERKKKRLDSCQADITRLAAELNESLD